jgi:hypothetical protein
VLVATARTAPGSKSRRRSPKRDKRIDAALLRCTHQAFLSGSQPRREPYRLLEAVEWVNLVGHNAPNLKAKTVRAEIHRGYQFVGHGEF